MALDQDEDEFLGFSGDEGDGINTESDSKNEGDADCDVEDVAVEINAHQYGDIEDFEPVPDSNEFQEPQIPEEEGTNYVGQQQTTTGISNIVNVPYLFDLNIPLIEESKKATQHINEHHKPLKPRVGNEMRLEILVFLLERRKPWLNKLIYGTIKEASLHFGYTPRNIGKIWNKAKRQKEAMQTYDLSNKYHNCGRKRVQVRYEDIAYIAMGDRTCIRDLAKMLNLGQTTVWRLMKTKVLKARL